MFALFPGLFVCWVYSSRLKRVIHCGSALVDVVSHEVVQLGRVRNDTCKMCRILCICSVTSQRVILCNETSPFSHVFRQAAYFHSPFKLVCRHCMLFEQHHWGDCGEYKEHGECLTSLFLLVLCSALHLGSVQESATCLAQVLRMVQGNMHRKPKLAWHTESMDTSNQLAMLPTRRPQPSTEEVVLCRSTSDVSS
jgi:hypothetical protein